MNLLALTKERRMCAMISNHEKSSLVSILFALTDVECSFKKGADNCPLQLPVEMTKKDRYRELEAMGLRELEDLYQNHCQCALKTSIDQPFVETSLHYADLITADLCT